jgi:hypothetical protein
MGSVTSVTTTNGGVTSVVMGLYNEQVEVKREVLVDDYLLFEKHNEQGNFQRP